MGYSPNTIFCSLSIALYHHEPKFFIHHPTMMLYPTNSAGRRQQQPCTTTIRSRRAHPRHVLDTAALNAYVPNNVGSKSHNELTWDHVVTVFTFFGLLMTALVSLCCYSHFQFVVARRRLAPNITVKGAGSTDANGDYKHTTDKDDVPKWYTSGTVMKYHIFGGSETVFNVRTADGWVNHVK